MYDQFSKVHPAVFPNFKKTKKLSKGEQKGEQKETKKGEQKKTNFQKNFILINSPWFKKVFKLDLNFASKGSSSYRDCI